MFVLSYLLRVQCRVAALVLDYDLEAAKLDADLLLVKRDADVGEDATEPAAHDLHRLHVHVGRSPLSIASRITFALISYSRPLLWL